MRSRARRHREQLVKKAESKREPQQMDDELRKMRLKVSKRIENLQQKWMDAKVVRLRDKISLDIPYSDVVDSADQVYAAFFCQKVIAMVRAPDQFVYLPPFNLLEAFVIAPLEWLVSQETYAKINYTVQSVLFAPPLMCIAFYESRAARNGGSIRLPLLETEEEDRTTSVLGGTHEDPILPEIDGSGGLQISRTKFEDLVSKMQS
ncbi:related to YVC1 - vacuolar cation channel [Ustilago sp. UG-2017a]|nr:related to YVC1 - vacuolar cation channel [Ustilago sp. UG-2017a]